MGVPHDSGLGRTIAKGGGGKLCREKEKAVYNYINKRGLQEQTVLSRKGDIFAHVQVTMTTTLSMSHLPRPG